MPIGDKQTESEAVKALEAAKAWELYHKSKLMNDKLQLAQAAMNAAQSPGWLGPELPKISGSKWAEENSVANNAASDIKKVIANAIKLYGAILPPDRIVSILLDAAEVFEKEQAAKAQADKAAGLSKACSTAEYIYNAKYVSHVDLSDAF